MIENKKRNILVVGGEFNNKGAQAMSFITLSRLISKFPSHNILFVSGIDVSKDKKERENYNFEIIQDPFLRSNFPGENFLRKMLKKKIRIDPKQYRNVLKKTDYMFDISGYALSSQWGEKKVYSYINRLKMAQQLGIKTIIMPQSIGPFDFEEKTAIVTKEINNALENIELIMPREPQGTRELIKIGIGANVVQSSDLVLTNKEEIEWNLIYRQVPSKKAFDIDSNSVAIIPNMRNFDHGNKEAILDLYKFMIEKIRKNGKNVYLIRHSGEDLKACYLIKDRFLNDQNVKVIAEDMVPTEFEELIKKFDFSIASRFHSVVHAYKVGTPCVIIGWAIKYLELAKLFDQEQYVFDVRENFNIDIIINKLDILLANNKDEKKKIERGLELLSEQPDPFDLAFKEIEC